MKTREQFKYDKQCAEWGAEALKPYGESLDGVRDLMQNVLHFIARERDEYCCPECSRSWPEPFTALLECCESAMEDFPHELDRKWKELTKKGQDK